ncbi:MAG: universal stress protein [Thermodesulfobacteriota bacterium]
MTKKLNVLMAFDGSDQSMDAVRYISRFFPENTTHVNLFHVATEVPEAFLDLSRDPVASRAISSVTAWAAGIKQNITNALTKATTILRDEGFPVQAIKATYHHRKAGVARDILAESRNGYDVLVVGRCGISRIQEVVLGSVVNKLLSVSDHLPMAVIGGCPETEKILIGFDGSTGAFKAVDCVCDLMASDERDVMLCHVVRSLNIFLNDQQIFGSEEEKLWLDETRQAVEKPMLEAEQKLIDAGFHPGRTCKQILENKITRAGGIVQAAREGGYGTIVMGRRGLSAVEEFLMGRVSRKVLHMGTQRAVWIV